MKQAIIKGFYELKNYVDTKNIKINRCCYINKGYRKPLFIDIKLVKNIPVNLIGLEHLNKKLSCFKFSNFDCENLNNFCDTKNIISYFTNQVKINPDTKIIDMDDYKNGVFYLFFNHQKITASELRETIDDAIYFRLYLKFIKDQLTLTDQPITFTHHYNNIKLLDINKIEIANNYNIDTLNKREINKKIKEIDDYYYLTHLHNFNDPINLTMLLAKHQILKYHNSFYKFDININKDYLLQIIKNNNIQVVKNPHPNFELLPYNNILNKTLELLKEYKEQLKELI